MKFNLKGILLAFSVLMLAAVGYASDCSPTKPPLGEKAKTFQVAEVKEANAFYAEHNFLAQVEPENYKNGLLAQADIPDTPKAAPPTPTPTNSEVGANGEPPALSETDQKIVDAAKALGIDVKPGQPLSETATQIEDAANHLPGKGSTPADIIKWIVLALSIVANAYLGIKLKMKTG